MREQGILIKIDGNVATVRLSMSGGCGSCGSKDACVAGSSGARAISAVIAPGLSAEVGDFVALEIPAKVQAAGILWLVLFPVLLFAAGYAGAGRIFPGASEGVSALGGMLGMAFGLFLATLVTRKGSLAARPTVVSVENAAKLSADAATAGCATRVDLGG